MANQHSNNQSEPLLEEPEIERKITTKYSRPIEFIAGSLTTSTNDNKRQKKISNGDEVASFYRSILTSTKKADNINNTPSAIQDKKDSVEIWWCASCSQSIPLPDYKRHIQGTTHMVSKNIGNKPVSDTLTLNGKNIGFKMLRSQGWKYEEGLGPEGQGRRLPISTVLKKDRLCIGHKETGRKAVTHKYRDIEKNAIERQRMEANNRKDPGKEIARKAKAETERRKAILRYMKD